MIFDESCFDKYFLAVIQQTSDAFNFSVLRQEKVIDPDTKSVSTGYRGVDSGLGNWSSPLEAVEYDLDGVVSKTDALIFVPAGTDVKTQDLIYRSDRVLFYRVMGTTDYGSHIDLDCMTVEVGSNFTLLDSSSELPDLINDAVVVI